jgi:hypothetical protein
VNFKADEMVDSRYFADAAAVFFLGAATVAIAITQIVNYRRNRVARERARQFHKIVWVCMILDGILSMIMAVDLRGVLIIYDYKARGLMVLLLTANILTPCIEWTVNLIKYVATLESFGQAHERLELAVKLMANLGYYVVLVVVIVLANQTDKAKTIILVLLYLDMICLISLVFQFYAMRKLYTFTVEKLVMNTQGRGMLKNETDQMEERFKLPVSRMLLTWTAVSFLSVLFTTCTVLILDPQVGDTRISVLFYSNPNAYRFDFFTLLIVMCMVTGGCLAVLLSWIPLDEDKHDWISRLTFTSLHLTWKLLGSKIFGKVEKQITDSNQSRTASIEGLICDSPAETLTKSAMIHTKKLVEGQSTS